MLYIVTCVPHWAEPGPAPLNFVERFVRVSLTALVYICVGTVDPLSTQAILLELVTLLALPRKARPPR